VHIHFVYLLLLLLVAAAVHAARMPDRSIPRSAEMILLYLLVGYCGVPMLAVSIWALVSPEAAARGFGFASPGPLLAFFGYAYLGMSLLSLLALRYRQSFLIGPAVVWAVYLGGATLVHLDAYRQRADHPIGGALEIFASHGLIAVLLVIALLASGVWRRPA
jgi:ABC-type dipeptide/oligopeptide/nickel transport system permease subunit